MSFAEDVNYWKTGKSPPDVWLDRAKKEILKAKGKIHGSGFVEEDITGKASYMLAFELDGEYFKILWPVLKPKSSDLKAARIQAATALYHEVKNAAVKIHFQGAKNAFIAYWVLPGGKTVSETTAEELLERLPPLLVSGIGDNA